MSEQVEKGEWPTGELPDSWIWAQFRDFFKDCTDTRRKLPTKNYEIAGLYPVIDQGEELIGGYSDNEHLVSQAGTPCIVWGDHTRCVKFLDRPFIQGADGVKVLRPTAAIDAHYAFRAMQAIKLPDKGYSRHFKFLRSSQFPVPPRPEQCRIVAKLDKLFAWTKSTRDELNRIPPLIEDYKQAILEKAFTGELTADWRAKRNPERVQAPNDGINPRSGDDLFKLPDEWKWTYINHVADVGGGLTKNASREVLALKVPYLRVANVYANELRLEEVKEIGCTERELGSTALQEDDILIVEGNGSIEQIGRVAMWDGSITPCSHQNHLIRARAKQDLLPAKLLLLWLLSPFGRRCIEQVASSTAGLHTLSISKVSRLPVPLMSWSEAQAIVTRIEAALSWTAAIENDLQTALSLVPHLDQAVLNRAFRGELVPQDPNEEPAENLLNRIKEEAGAQPKARRGRGGRDADSARA
jgi:type I restriction enzyme S subunit